MKWNRSLFKTTCSCILSIAVFSMFSCTKNFEDMNTNPNNATDEMMQYDNLSTGGFFPQMQQNVFPAGQGPVGDENRYANEYQRGQNLIGDIFSGYMGATNTWYSNQNNSTYALVQAWNAQPFSNTFQSVMPAWLSIKRDAELTNPTAYALAQIIKVEAVHRTTDIYGPLPYFKFGASSVSSPYDAQDTIYYSFFHELDSAIAVLTDFVDKYPGVKPLAKYDLIYGGDFTKWIVFANSLKLRLAMRIVYVDLANAKKYAEQAVSNRFGVMQTNADNALLQNAGGLIIPNPLYVICYSYNDIRMGATMESFLKGYSDPRIAYHFNKSATYNDYFGVRTGINVNTNYQNLSTLNVNSSTPIPWMTAAEMYFLRAEGTIRGWSMGGTAKDLYETGIQTSFDQTGSGSAATYIANSTSKPAAYVDKITSGYSIALGNTNLSTITIKWSDTDPFETKLERVITQKWLAMYPDGQEAWSEFRRTRYPKVFPVAVNNSGNTINTATQIRRIPFPQGEYQNNSAEVQKAITLLGGPDNGGTKLWWDKKP